MCRIGVSVKQQFTEEEIYKDRDSQISAIEKTFEDAQKSVCRLLTNTCMASKPEIEKYQEMQMNTHQYGLV